VLARPDQGWAPRLSQVLSSFGLAPGSDAIAYLARWLDLLVMYAARIDLTAARDADELVDLMVADAALLAGSALPGQRWVDVGSGAGAPGLALALLRPDLAMTLVEPRQKRAGFLRTVVGAMDAARIEIVQARGEDLAAKEPGFDVAVSRAALPPPEWLSLGSRLIGLRGAVWVLLARDAPPVLAGLCAAAERSYAWPLTAAARRAVVYRHDA
jgi:16S rRNA (guanine527-N7)-methyltransferase